ncbi:endoplasmic reticulum mannosyl-oligosaccharide 1:2-alpha-mannosidase-like protein, partial [Dinothrombium tinctorium]
KWRSMPRFIQLYICLLLIAITLLFAFALFAPSNQMSAVDNNEKIKLLEETVIKAALNRQHTSTKSTSFKSVKKDLNDKRISWEADLKDPIIPPNDKQLKIIEAMRHSWSGYLSHAWGYDNLKPITKEGSNWFGVGLTIIDSLDTLLLMGLEKEYNEALEWVKNDLTFDVNRYVNCFEMTIRVLGGLLSAYHLTDDPILAGKAEDIGERLIHCFDSPSKVIPYSDVHLKTKRAKGPLWSPDSTVAEISSMQIEFRDLSRVLKRKKYEYVSFKTSQTLHNLSVKNGDPLVPMYINPISVRFTPSTITLGARSDSYYEYLLKQYLQTGIRWLQDDYLKAVEAINDRLVRTTQGPLKLTFIGENLRNSEFYPKMDHLTCFFAGTLALGYYHNTLNERKDLSDVFEQHLEFAKSLARTCYYMYNLTATGLSPEIAHFHLAPTLNSKDELIIRSADTHNLLRPEYVESLFYLYHITKDENYRDEGWEIFEAFNRHCRVETGGYTSIDNVLDVNETRPKNFQESFWTAETLKYLFLLFSDDKVLIHKLLNNYIFNTEAHLIPL